MTAHTRFRVAVAIGALLAPLAVVAATSAPANALPAKHKHEVYIYKVEKNLKLAGVGTDTVGDSTAPTLSCDPGDTVLDGMWRVKSVDQYQPPPPDPDEDPDFPSTSTAGGVYNDVRDVHVVASYPDQLDARRWNYQFENRAYGDAQLKLYVTCVRGYTEYTNSHRHQIEVQNLTSVAASTSDHPSWSGVRSYYEWGGAPCAAGRYFVAPGFKLDNPATDHRLVGSYPKFGSAGLAWTWEFGGTGLTSATFYGKCISRKVLTGASHQHALAMKHMPSADPTAGHLTSIPVGDPYEVRYSCDQDEPSYSGYKAAVGWFWMGNYWEDTWFLGMEPRPKTRAYSFWNGGASSAQVTLGTLCINSRTANPIL
ncbi:MULTISPECIES: hypothetical protein [unclassified Nocardioides]|uniref:hypothetical protein n=1 Tax=unclassified Nocardioides TaxID=2615069 RepID=UPI0000570E0B|nr:MULTISPECIES: hypothetical protein [unclassified Nocardioides]ABL84105.1 hypothetical protein Noca_4610 [Nocardioides sp. JS614]